MKLRFSDNHVRIRLSSDNLEELEKNASLNLKLDFTNQQVFECSVQLSKTHSNLFVEYTNGTLEVFIPEAKAKHWIHSKTEGLYATIDVDNGESILVAIERDFGPRS